MTDQRSDDGPGRTAHDVLVVGGSGVDTVVRVDSLPVPLADTVDVSAIREWPGHTGGNVALGCRALGLGVKFLDFVGDDWTGAQVRARLAEGDVDFEALTSPSGTRRAVSLVERTGRRMSFQDAREPAGLKMPRAFYLPHLRAARHVHLSVVDFARHLFDDIVEAGVPVSTDLQDWDGLSGHQREFALRADLVFLSATGAGGRIAAVMKEILREGRAEVVVATAGAGGSYLMTRAAPSPRPIAATVPPAPVVDSNGAGDAYVCGFLYGRLTGRGLEECAELGARAGAFACTGQGPAALIGRDELLKHAG
ncbi:carbohydrate kinase family protein [Streptomyces sp. NBC_01497]|uniref:carbohydrate kinase family protein n=1 Tax=Streptomyces sp. NBC_01497 TaxID=2903885 RepID=UPI002E3059F2|nr:carbohydrate kinase family protein [Streptomyces sp. NBC_01497]